MKSNDKNIGTIVEKYPYLSFKDWLAKRPYESENWLVVAQHTKSSETDDFRTYCALASVGLGHLEKLTSHPHWEINRVGGDYFGAPYFEESDEKEIVYQSGQHETIDDITFQPLVIHREFKDHSLDRFEISQVFILYYNAFEVESEGIYRRINENGDLEDVLRISKPREDETIILVNKHLLKNYLAANKSYLVRYHDHRRLQTNEIDNEEQGMYRISTFHSCFDIVLRRNIMSDKFKGGSRLIGKDIIEPYPKPNEQHYHYLRGERERKFVNFIIGHDEDGKEIEETCDEKRLSSYFKDRGTPHFLTPVYFKGEVLVKYINQPSWKSLGIDYNKTAEGLIMVWLGDLGRISYEEQLYWRSFNVAPSGPVPKEVVMRDIMGVLVEPEGNVVYDFRKAFELLQKKSRDRYSEPLFKPLRDRDEHIEKWIRLPIFDTPREFDDIILGLAKLTSDSLNVDLLESLTRRKIDPNDGIYGKIDLLSVYLDDLSVENETKEKIIFGLRMVNKLRSKGAAHPSGDDFLQQMERFKLVGLTTTKAIEKVVIQLTLSLQKLIDVVDSLD